MSRKLFGTDGVRGRANVDLTPELALALGKAAGRVLVDRARAELPGRPHVIVGSDTRRSGPMLAGALSAGLCAAGVDVIDVGVIPTPGVAYLALEQKAIAGVVVSASHNPAPDNGIKFFGADGYKLDDETEAMIEAALDSGEADEASTGRAIGTAKRTPVTGALYEGHLVSTVGEGSLAGLKVVVDCAHGAGYQAAPSAYAAAGADVEVKCAEPDGDNINEQCGSTNPEGLGAAVIDAGADLGLAFDGDADRVIAADADGSVVDGDQMLAIAATWLAGEGRLPGMQIVATVMANLGLRIAMRDKGIEVVECPVGDRYVIEAMRREGIALGGEQSGHVIFHEHATTGDGLLTGLQLMHVMAHSGSTLGELASVMERLPQVLINVEVRDRSALEGASAIWDAVAEAEARLGEYGRVLLRPSGTEQLIRVMVEAETDSEAEQEANGLAEIVKREMGPEE